MTLDREVQILKEMALLTGEVNKKQESINANLIDITEILLKKCGSLELEIARLKQPWWKRF